MGYQVVTGCYTYCFEGREIRIDFDSSYSPKGESLNDELWDDKNFQSLCRLFSLNARMKTGWKLLNNKELEEFFSLRDELKEKYNLQTTELEK